MPTPWDKSLNLTDENTGWTPSEFSQRFKDAYGIEPSYLAASSFSTAEIIMAAIEHTDSLDPLVLTAAIHALSFSTIYGNVTFDENNQIQTPMLVVQQQKTDTFSVIYPYESALASYFPLPTWQVKECELNTEDCSGHGQCNENGKCVCDPGYYGGAVKTSCDTYCNGALAEDVERQEFFCKVDTTFYVGGAVSFAAVHSPELDSMLRLGVELVNNKNDGFFDDLAPQVYFNLTAAEWMCSYDGGATGIELLDTYIKQLTGSTETVIGAVIGPQCSSAR